MAHTFASQDFKRDSLWLSVRSSIASIFEQIEPHTGGHFRFLLVMRFILTNAVGLFFLAVIWHQGWLEGSLDSETVRLVAIIGAVFLFGLAWCGCKIVKVSNELNLLSTGRTGYPPAGSSRVITYLSDIEGLDATARSNMASALRLRLSTRISTIRHIANSLVILGLIGTVIGFMIALSGVNPDVVSDISAVGPMVSTLINGMSVALYTTLVGAVLNVWLMVNYRLLEGGTVNLLTKLVEIGERNARS